MLEICGNLAHLYIYQNVREQNETIFLILGRKIVAFCKRHLVEVSRQPFLQLSHTRLHQCSSPHVCSGGMKLSLFI